MKNDNFGFTVPKALTNKEHSFLTDSKAAKDWFDGLPMANAGETAKQTYQALKEFNRLDIPNKIRAQIIEMFRPPIAFIRENLERHYIEIGFPLNIKGTQSSNLAIALDTELSISYKIIANNILECDAESFDKNLLIITLHRISHYLLNILLQTAIIYQPYRKGAWKEIHSIYAYASMNKIHQVGIKDSKRPNFISSIEDVYKSCLLLATANPTRLRQSQIRQLFLKIPEWTSLINITIPDKDNSISSGQFYLELNSDEEPHRNIQNSANKSRSERIVDMNNLLDKLHDDFEQAPWDISNFQSSETEKLPKSLIRLLIKGWMKPKDRQFARTHLNFELSVIVGLYDIHRMLNALSIDSSDKAIVEKTRQDMFDNTHSSKKHLLNNQFDNLSLSSIDEDDSSLTDSHLSSQFNNKEPKDTDWLNTLPSEISEDLFCVLTCNESTEGYCLFWKGDKPPKIKVGELLGIQSTSTPSVFSLGVIRWLRQGKDNTLRLGLHIQSASCRAISVVSIDKKQLRKNRPRYQCLLLGSKEAETKIFQIITSAINFQLNTIFNMEIDNKVFPIKLLKLVESNGAFALYEFVYIDQQVDEEPKDSDDFNDLWSSI